MAGSSIGAFVQGEKRNLGQQRSYQVSKAGITTTFVPILTLKNSRIFGSRINQRELIPLSINISNTGGKPLEIQVFEQANLGADAYYQYVSTGRSPAMVDFSATTYGNGVARLSRSVATGQTAEIDLSKYDYAIEAGNQLTIIIKANSTTTDATVSLQWVQGQ
jgi:hypothetical protein